MLNEILVLLITVAADIYTLLVLLRLMLQGAKADFYNPISQFVVRATDPLLKPLRRIIPGFWGIDMASVALALLIQCVGILVLGLLAGQVSSNPFVYLLLSIFQTAQILLNFYFFALIILVVISWVAPGTHNPAASLLQQLTDPIMKPVRALLPDMGGLDFSPMIALFIIHILRAIVLPSMLASMAGFF